MATDLFSDLRPGTFIRCSASPAGPLSVKFRGIQIAARERVERWVTRSHMPKMPLAGLVTIDGSAAQAAPADDVIVVSASTGRTSRYDRLGGGKDRTDFADAEASSHVAPVSACVSLTNYFNVDLAETLDLPPTPAVYFVYAFLGPYVSNVVRIEVVDPDEAAP